MRNLGVLAKVLVFVAVTVLLTGGLVAVFGNFRDGNMSTYKAVFADVSGMEVGSDVRAAGVNVGRVDGIERQQDNSLLVTFIVQRNVPLTTGSSATVRYKNLVGDRYFQLGTGPGPGLEPGETLPRSQTHPALDLDELYNGFTPLFQGLAPDQVNRLSSSLIAVMQGQGDAIDGLLDHVGSLTSTLGNRDQLIGQVINRLNTVLETVNERAPELSDTIVNLQRVVSGLAADRGDLGNSVSHLNGLSKSVTGLLEEQRPDVKGTVNELGRLTSVLNKDEPMLSNLFRRLPGYYVPLGRVGANQAAFQFWVCGVRVHIPTPAGSIDTPFINAGNEDRC